MLQRRRARAQQDGVKNHLDAVLQPEVKPAQPVAMSSGMRDDLADGIPDSFTAQTPLEKVQSKVEIEVRGGQLFFHKASRVSRTDSTLRRSLTTSTSTPESGYLPYIYTSPALLRLFRAYPLPLTQDIACLPTPLNINKLGLL
eukprot:2507120-Rhodomonas_salina.3